MAITQRELTAAIRAAKSEGLTMVCEVLPDGTKRFSAVSMDAASGSSPASIDAAIDRGRW